MNTVIKVENLGKSYLIGHEGQKHDTLAELITSGVKSLIKSPGSVLKQKLQSGELEEFWALKDINFDVEKGDRVGIIGSNGAGKSTLLKILSRITEPSNGRISIKGRIASLLEVGTGFHNELSGRENIFLNGAILGMSRQEIRNKFDEIVAFSGVEKFLDTPVKRYSSGMYVRLAFAVAAHLDPDILVVDEVLAVGDVEFQKKCLDKMKNVSKNEGRTVLFVSHNMGALYELCNKGILLQKGRMVMQDKIDTVINKYISNLAKQSEFDITEASDRSSYISKVRFTRDNGQATDTFDLVDNINIEFTFHNKDSQYNPGFGFILYREGTPVFEIYSSENDLEKDISKETGTYRILYSIPNMLLKEGIYSMWLGSWGADGQKNYVTSPSFEIFCRSMDLSEKSYKKERSGNIVAPGKWKIVSQEK